MVRGSIDLTRAYGASDAASWHLLKNKSAKTGVAHRLRCAILLNGSQQDWR